MSATAARLPRPKMTSMRNMHKRYTYMHGTISLIFGMCVGGLYHIFVSVPRKKAYDDFFSTYDPYADFERMRNLGLFTSCPPDDVLKAQGKL